MKTIASQSNLETVYRVIDDGGMERFEIAHHSSGMYFDSYAAYIKQHRKGFPTPRIKQKRWPLVAMAASIAAVCSTMVTVVSLHVLH